MAQLCENVVGFAKLARKFTTTRERVVTP